MDAEDVFHSGGRAPILCRIASRIRIYQVKPPRALPRAQRSFAFGAVLLLVVLALVACRAEEAPIPGTIVTVAGPPEPGAEGGEAVPDARISFPVDLDFDRAGNIYVTQFFGQQIKMVDPDGVVTVVAGTGVRGYSGDGGPATEAALTLAYGVAVGPDGNLYIADTGNHRIRMVDQNGIITTIAGTGKPGFSGDGGAAAQAQLNRPMGMVFDSDGNLYIMDEGNFRIRTIDRNGTIRTVVGTGKPEFTPDGAPAAESAYGGVADHGAVGMAFDSKGALYFTDVRNSRIRKIDANGLVQTVAGNGENEHSGDGGPATEAGINEPIGIAFDAKGNLYISTHTHGGSGNRIRMVDPNGIITTIAGTDKMGYAGDGGPATEAQLDIPAGVIVGPDGNLYIADGLNHAIRMIALARD